MGADGHGGGAQEGLEGRSVLLCLLPQHGQPRTVLGPLRHASGLALQLGQDLLHDCLGIADETHLHSAVDTNLLWLDVDLDDLGVRGELAAEAEHPGEPCPDHQDHVGVPHQGAARRAEVQRVVIGYEAAPHRGGYKRHAQRLHQPAQFQGGLRPPDALAHDHHGPLGGAQQLGSPLDLVWIAQRPRLGIVVLWPAHAFFLDRVLEHVRWQIEIDRPRSPGTRLAEGHGQVLGQAGGTVHLHRHLGDALEHGNVLRFLEGAGVARPLGTRPPFWGRFLIEVTRHPSVGHRMGDCVYPIPPRRIPMSCHPRVTEWTMTIQTHLPHLTKPQATVLALWSLGMVLVRSCALTAVSAFLATWLGRKENTVRQQLREFCYDAAASRGTDRCALPVASCFVPLLAWVVSWWQGTQLALALDAT